MARNHRPKVGSSRRRRIYERDCWICQGCGVSFAHVIPNDPSEAPWIDGIGWLQLDHIIPIAAGGAVRDESNLQALCQPCNLRKGARV